MSVVEKPIVKCFLEVKLDEARGALIRFHIEVAKKSEKIFQSTKLIQKNYKFMHRIEVITELLEELE